MTGIKINHNDVDSFTLYILLYPDFQYHLMCSLTCVYLIFSTTSNTVTTSNRVWQLETMYIHTPDPNVVWNLFTD